MKPLLSVFLCLLVLVSGCASTISAVSEGPIHQSRDRSWGAWVDDQTIETVTAVNIEKASAALQNSHITVKSYNGNVLLVGQVPDAQTEAHAEEIARSVKKVRKVHNELQVAGNTTGLVRSNDTWLTSKIKTLMVTTEAFPADRVKVITENGIVYLMGLVTPREADLSVNIVKQVSGVQKIVKVFEYINN